MADKSSVFVAVLLAGLLFLMVCDSRWVEDAPTAGGKLARAASVTAGLIGMGWCVLRAAGLW